ncbi:hypothetical protein [Agarivorans sp. JK6]|uniref:hypothetical protein n=1 Tax=Agarivorans sp. JK6 TaxID=2997426 RepID=UPI0038730CBB
MTALLILLVCSGICAFLASIKGRNSVTWLIIGFLTGLLGIVIIICLSDLSAKDGYEHFDAVEHKPAAKKRPWDIEQ